MIDEQNTPPVEAPTQDSTPPATDDNSGNNTPPVETPPADNNDDTFDESLIDPEVRDYKPAETPPEDDDDIDPEERERINKIVGRSVGSQVQQLEQKYRVDAFFSENKEFAKYKNATAKYLSHPDYKHLPINNVVAIVAAKDMQKIGAAKEREAQRRVQESSNPGTGVRQTNAGSFNWATAPKDQFEQQKLKY